MPDVTEQSTKNTLSPPPTPVFAPTLREKLSVRVDEKLGSAVDFLRDGEPLSWSIAKAVAQDSTPVAVVVLPVVTAITGGVFAAVDVMNYSITNVVRAAKGINKLVNRGAILNYHQKEDTFANGVASYSQDMRDWRRSANEELNRPRKERKAARTQEIATRTAANLARRGSRGSSRDGPA